MWYVSPPNKCIYPQIAATEILTFDLSSPNSKQVQAIVFDELKNSRVQAF